MKNSGQFTTETIKGENNPKWKGDEVGYSALHAWVKREKGNAEMCSECQSTDNVWWANKSKKYQRDLNDWIALCCVCHRKYDGITKLSRQDAKDIRDRYNDGVMQKTLANEYGVDQGTISNIVNRKIKYYG